MSSSTGATAVRRGAPRLYWRIYLHGVGLLILVALALSVSAWLFDPQPISMRVPRVLAAALRDQPEGEALAAEVRRLAAEARVAVALYRDDGRLLGSGGADAPPPLAPADVARLRRSGDPIVHMHRLIAVPAGNERYLAMALSRGFVEPFVKHILVALLVVVSVLAVGSLPLARTVARPIERLSETARRLGAGELSVRSNVRTSDEIGELGAAFDEMAERLQRLVEGQRELLANVSHELRTPLARLHVTLGLAAESDADGVRRYLDEIGVDVAELERMVADLLTAARLEAGYGSVLRVEGVAVADALADAARRFERVQRGRVLTVDVADGLPVLEVDPPLLGRSLDNLLDNAAKYSEADAPVAVAATWDGEHVTIDVRDSGIGIDPEDLPRLFTPFFRTDRSRSRGTGGVGLGLALAKRIVEAHGGTIVVTSRPGEGTTVRLRLPAPASGGRSPKELG